MPALTLALRCTCIGCAWILLACGPSARSTSLASDAPPTAGWTRNAETVLVAAHGGIGDFFRKISYSRSAGTLSVEDSDPFAGGREQHPPRVVRASRVLSAEQRGRVERILGRVQPNEAALARRCAPGGCLWIEIDGDERLEDDASVRPALVELSRFFPQLRAY